jgi:hypothetical protein
MSVIVWDTRQPAPAGFEEAWAARLAGSWLWNFSMDLVPLRWEAARGKHARLALVEADGRRAAVVLREERDGWASGWPWRWQVAIERGDEAFLRMSHEDARWLYAQCNALAGGRRLRLHLPVAPAGSAPSFFAGATLIKDLRPSEDELFKSLDGNKRRAVNKARREGFTVTPAAAIPQLRTFAELHHVVEARHGYHHPPLAESPGPTEAWREWELPWMTLLVAEREGRVEAGSGFGVTAGGLMDYRVNASTAEALKQGANALLAWEALCLGRQRGMRAMNWGGVTTFKSEMRGERVESHCWLGGGPLWAIPNHVVAGTRAARAKLATMMKSGAAAGD